MSSPPAPVPDRDHTRHFLAHRATLIGVAYRMLSSLSDAEDVVQEAWLRWAEVDLAGVRDPRAYLVTVATRLALNRLREQARWREDYPGPWLPEPVSTTDDPARAAEVAEDVSLALLVVLSALSPPERAAFVLHDVFAVPFAEIAETLERSEAAVRQLASRARAHVRDSAPRQPVDAATHAEVTERFRAAAASGSLEPLVALLAPDAVLVSDGGGRRQAALRPIEGREKILRFFAGVWPKLGPAPEVGLAQVNGEAAITVAVDGELDSVVVLELDGPLVRRVLLIRNPDKLHGVRLAPPA